MSYDVIWYPNGGKYNTGGTLSGCGFVARDGSVVFDGYWFVVTVNDGNQICNIIHCYKNGFRVKHLSAFPDGTTQLEAIEILNRLWNA